MGGSMKARESLMDEFDNRFDLYESGEFNVLKIRGRTFKKYLARIVGEHEVFGLDRRFLSYDRTANGWESVHYTYEDICDGVYETSVRYFEKGNLEPLLIDRKICVVVDGDTFNYRYGVLDRKTILRLVKLIQDGSFSVEHLPAGFLA